MPSPRFLVWRVLLLTVLAVLVAPIRAAAQTASAADLQAAFLINFARFTEWPASQNGRALQICVVDDSRVAKAVATVSRGQLIGDRRIEMVELEAGAAVDTCDLLFIGRKVRGDTARMLTRARALPILTVSDLEGFALEAGIIELIVDDGRMRFAVNTATARRAGLRLSSRLLGLAMVVHGG